MYRQLVFVSLLTTLPIAAAAQEATVKSWYFGVALGSAQFDPPASNTLSATQSAGGNLLPGGITDPLTDPLLDPITAILPPLTGSGSPLPDNPLTGAGSTSSVDGNYFDIDGSSTLARVVVGWQLWSFLSLEGGYGSLGKYEEDFDPRSAETGKAKANVTAGFLGLQANTSRERNWGLYGKAGIARWKVSGDLEEDGTDPYAGLGVFRQTSDSGRINFGVERFVIDEESIDAVTIEFIAQY